MSNSHDHDRVWGLLAVQLGFLDAATLARQLAAFKESRAGAGFAAWLAARGALSQPDVALLEACVSRALAVHGDATRALGALSRGAQALTVTQLDDTHQSGERTSAGEALDTQFVVAEMPGRYTSTEAELGRGGLGRVLAFKDHVLGRTVAWKELHRSDELDPLALQRQEARFLREARLAAQLEHPSIVPVYEVGRRLEGTVFFTMRRIEGRTLADALDQAGSLEGRLKLMPHVIATAQALAYAHSRDVLHRDVKPQNVMFGRFGETYLLDWGLAKVKAHDSQDPPSAPDLTGAMELGAVGTPSYMSPEQAAGRHDIIDHRTDVWGLGAILYQVLTGRAPWVADSAVECIQRILRDEVLPPKELEPGAPNDLVAVCLKALSRSPDARYPTAGAMVDDLQAWLEGRTVSAREYSLTTRALRFARRNRLAVSVVSALLLALVTSASLFTWRINEQRREARALSSTVLRSFIDHLAYLPGASTTIQEVADPSLAFFRAQGSLSPSEQVLFGRTLAALGKAHVALGRTDAASAAFDECARSFPLNGVDLTSAALRVVAVDCALGQSDVLFSQSRLREVDEVLGRVREVLVVWDGRDRDDPLWLGMLVQAWGRLTRAAQNANDGARLLEASGKEWEFDLRALRARPDDPDIIANHLAVAAARALALFDPQQPQPALDVIDEGLAAARRMPRDQLQPQRLRNWLMLMEVSAMTGAWAGRPELPQVRLAEARPLYERLIAIEPDEQQGHSIYGDLLLDAGKPCEAKALYDMLVERGARGANVTSQLLAALACDDLTPFRALTPELVAQHEDQELHWLYALFLVRDGRVREGVAELDAWKDRAAQGAQQWPRGVLDGLPARVPAPQRAVVEQFLRDSEQRLAQGGESVLDTFAPLADGLRATLD